MGLRMRILLLLAGLFVTGCDPLGVRERERYVITETSPFYEAQVPFDPDTVHEVVNAVRAFADDHSMDLLVAQQSLPSGMFNVSANGPTINLAALHSSIKPDIQILAYSRDEPTDLHWELVREFESVVRVASRDSSTDNVVP